MDESVSAEARYKALHFDREPFLRRAREAATVTLPAIMPPLGHNPHQELPQPYSGLGARCVLHLSSRLLTALLPPGGSIFRFNVPAEVLVAAGEDKVPPALETKLALAEQVVHSEIERRGWRLQTNMLLQHLLICGNALEQSMPDNTVRTFALSQYVVTRDPTGNLMELIIDEQISRMAIPPLLREYVPAGEGPTKVSLYTWLRRDGDRWVSQQEIAGQIVEGSVGSFTNDAFPFRALRWSPVLGEAYGRGKVEENIADFRALNGLSKSVLDGAALASRNVTMLRPNAAGGLNLRRRITEARNGDVVVGNPEDIVMMQFTNVGGMQFTAAELAALKQEISAAWLLNSGLRRDAERVTAFELRQMVEELEGTLGGAYSSLSETTMGPRIARLIVQMQGNSQLPVWEKGTLEPVVLVGLAALGREADVNRVMAASQLVQPLGETAQRYVDWEVLLRKGFEGLGLANAVRKTEDVQAEIQREQQAQMAQQVAPVIAQAAAQPQG